MTDTPTMTPDALSIHGAVTRPGELTTLVITWARDEPSRVGEIVPIPSRPAGRTWVLGRGEPSIEQRPQRLRFYRQRPGLLEPMPALQSPRLSREHLQVLEPSTGNLCVRNVGRCALLLNGDEVQEAEVRPGDVLELKDQLQLLCVRRLEWLPEPPADVPLVLHSFGEADGQGLVGETPVIWELRTRIVFIAGGNTHVLVQGASGTGKELIARALHALSARGRRPLVSRNAATFPETLIDAELFGNTRNFPNAGMQERPGLIGEADGTTLFLDEIGELPEALQAHLLRVLDHGEYQRLGESTVRRSNLRLVAATNRPEEHLKHDLLARLRNRLSLPDLNARREDIPLVARHLVRVLAAEDRRIALRYFDQGDPRGEPRFTPGLMRALVQHRYRTHVRELEAFIWQSMTHSAGSYLDLNENMQIDWCLPERDERAVDPDSIPPEVIQACLDRHQGYQDAVWRELGLPNRFALYRLIKRHGLNVRRTRKSDVDEVA